MAITIGIKALAEYATADSIRQRTILKNYKKKLPSGAAQANYYNDAISSIKRFYEEDLPADWLKVRARDLKVKAHGAAEQVATRYSSNARALMSYARNCSSRDFKILTTPKCKLTLGQVTVGTTATLYVEERGRRRLVKLDFSKNPLGEHGAKIIVAGIHDSVRELDYIESPKHIEYMAVHTGESTKGSKDHVRASKEIEATARNIEAIWPTI